MAGILNSKERLLDTIVTLEGRRQIVGGNLQIKYAAFSDRFTFYRGDVVSGSDDASKRLFFETVSLPSDQITFEADDSGALLHFNNAGATRLHNGKIVQNAEFATGSLFASLATGLLTSSVDHFTNLRVIGTNDYFREDTQFRINNNKLTFSINEERPIGPTKVQSISVDKADSFFQDRRLSHIPNFKFMPPKNKAQFANVEGSPLGLFQPLGQEEILSYEQLEKELEGKEFFDVKFSDTSRDNNLFAQFFEVSPNNLKKLDVIDFGTFPSSGQNEDLHVFFVGKVYIDDLGRSTFLNLFTMVFS